MAEEKKIVLQGSKTELMQRIPIIMDLFELLESKDVGTIYAHTNDRFYETRERRPKISLFFLEDSNYNKKSPLDNLYEGRRRVEGIISFRLMNETTQSFSQSNATILGSKIKQVFGANNGFIWNKGKTLYSYSDWAMGYQFQLLCKTETEAKRIVTSVLSLQGHTPNWLYFNTIKNDAEQQRYPEVPSNHIVMGKTLPLPRQRPIVDVRFQYAYAELNQVKEPIILYDRSKKKAEPLVS